MGRARRTAGVHGDAVRRRAEASADSVRADVESADGRQAFPLSRERLYALSPSRAALGGLVHAKKKVATKIRTERSRLREKSQQIADELRRLIVSGKLSEGESLGHEPDLVERFGVSRPSLREALRILEAEGLISVVRGMLGGIVVHEPNERMTARTAALLLQSRNVSLADV